MQVLRISLLYEPHALTQPRLFTRIIRRQCAMRPPFLLTS